MILPLLSLELVLYSGLFIFKCLLHRYVFTQMYGMCVTMSTYHRWCGLFSISVCATFQYCSYFCGYKLSPFCF